MKTTPEPRKILAIDIGGSTIKATVMDQDGDLQFEYKKVETPVPGTPDSVLQAIKNLVSGFPEFDCISAGFPGYVRDGVVHTAPNLDNEAWKMTDLNQALADLLGKPARVVNDADLAALGISQGKGLEMVMTLGTGFGTALLLNGVLLPHLELSHLPATKSKDFDQYIGEKVLQEIGEKKWNKRMIRVLQIFKTVINYDILYIGGGNSKRLRFSLDDNVKIISNRDGIKGGARLWDDIAVNVQELHG